MERICFPNQIYHTSLSEVCERLEQIYWNCTSLVCGKQWYLRPTFWVSRIRVQGNQSTISKYCFWTTISYIEEITSTIYLVPPTGRLHGYFSGHWDQVLDGGMFQIHLNQWYLGLIRQWNNYHQGNDRFIPTVLCLKCCLQIHSTENHKRDLISTTHIRRNLCGIVCYKTYGMTMKDPPQKTIEEVHRKSFLPWVLHHSICGCRTSKVYVHIIW